MLSGRGIDGELKSKFGEWSEKFWQSGAKNGNFQAIYFANGGGGSGGQTLSAMKSNGGKQVVSAESGDKVKSVFGICANGQNGDGCQENKNNTSVVMVGSDNQLSPELKQKIKNEWNWTSGNGSVVDGGHKYSGLFSQIKMKNGKPPTGGKFNGPSFNLYQRRSSEKKVLLENLCPWIKKINDESGRQCKSGNFSRGSGSNLKLPQFLGSPYARNYFGEEVWKGYPAGGKYLALLALLNLWSTDLSQMNFDLSKDIFDSNQEKFKLEHLMNSNGEVIYLNAGNGRSDLKAISYHSGGGWEVQLCPNSNGCSNDEGLNLTMGNEKFCVVKDVCFSESDDKNHIQNGKLGWGNLKGGSNTALWSLIFGNKNRVKPNQAALISLVAASFEDIKNVSLTVQKPLKDGEVVFTQLNNEK